MMAADVVPGNERDGVTSQLELALLPFLWMSPWPPSEAHKEETKPPGSLSRPGDVAIAFKQVQVSDGESVAAKQL
jgi:hypothetical protein